MKLFMFQNEKRFDFPTAPGCTPEYSVKFSMNSLSQDKKKNWQGSFKCGHKCKMMFLKSEE